MKPLKYKAGDIVSYVILAVYIGAMVAVGILSARLAFFQFLSK